MMQAHETSVANGNDVLPTRHADGAGSGAGQSGIVAQYITFTIDEEEYGIDIMSVREIKGWSDTTMLPNTPEYMRGVLNLRGIIVPIFDLRCRFSLGRTEATSLHVIVIIEVGDRLMGILVDTVSDILSIDISEIRAVPELGRQVGEEYLTGLVTVNGRMVALLETDKLFNADDMEQALPAVTTAD